LFAITNVEAGIGLSGLNPAVIEISELKSDKPNEFLA